MQQYSCQKTASILSYCSKKRSKKKLVDASSGTLYSNDWVKWFDFRFKKFKVRHTPWKHPRSWNKHEAETKLKFRNYCNYELTTMFSCNYRLFHLLIQIERFIYNRETFIARNVERSSLLNNNAILLFAKLEIFLHCDNSVDEISEVCAC